MTRSDHPSALTPRQRRREISELLAAGVLRLRRLAALAPPEPASPAKTIAESAGEPLEAGAETVLSVTSG